MKKIIILGPGASGKTTLAKKLSQVLNIPHLELDKYFWQPGLIPTPINQWKNIQKKLVVDKAWIIDGDLGKYDALEVRLKAADTIIILDFPLLCCLSRAIKRDKEKFDFWWWLITWRFTSRPKIMRLIKIHSPKTRILIFKQTKELNKFILSLHPPTFPKI